VAIAKQLEELGHKIYLPQRDGFEFSQLTSLFPKEFSEMDKSKAVAWIIYLADLAKLSSSTICLANLDEPLDPGVLIEIMYAKQLGIPTIGYRCDSRTPFGARQSWNFGMHFFAIFQCDYFIQLQNVNAGSLADANQLITELVEKINEIQADMKPKITAQKFDDIKTMAANLIPPDVLKLSQLPLQELVDKYVELKPQLEKMEPEMVSLRLRAEHH
jgi:hypothetical protein